MIVVRTTCTRAVGLGHYRRCLTLAREIAEPVVFAMVVDDSGRTLAAEDGIALREVAQGPEATLAVVDELAPRALIADDYALSADAIAALHARVPHLLALDDGADRALDVDAVLNANPAAVGLAYDVPARCLQLLGPRYALLRRELRDLPPRTARDDVERVLVTLGGSNPGGRTRAIAENLAAAMPHATVDVVAGPLFEGELPDAARVVVHRSPRNMVELMLRADLAISAGGQTTYELAACGVPTVALCVADNQRANLEALAHIPTLRVASDTGIVADACALAADRAARQAMAAAGQRVFDGRGAERAWAELAARWA